MKKTIKKLILIIILFVAVTWIVSSYMSHMKNIMEHGRDTSSVTPSRNPSSLKTFTNLDLPSKLPSHIHSTPDINNEDDIIEEWEEQLMTELEILQPEGQIKIYNKKDQLYTYEGNTIKAKIVTIQISHKSWGKSTYNALVNPESGKILKTWNLPKFENYDKSNRFQLVYKGP